MRIRDRLAKNLTRRFPDLARLATSEQQVAAYNLAQLSLGWRRHAGAYFVLVLVLVLTTAIMLSGIMARWRSAYPIIWIGLGAGALVWGFDWYVVRHLTRRAIRTELNRRSLPVCVHCGYDLTGNVSGVCPECGRVLSHH